MENTENVIFKLHSPMTIASGAALSELSLDFESLTTADLRAAQKIRALACDPKAIDAGSLMGGLRLDSEFQIAVGFLAACKGTPGLTQTDFLRLSMLDAVLLGEEAADYFFSR